MRRPGRMVNEVLRSVVRTPATVRYPAEKVVMPEKFRGRIDFEARKCIGCRLCMRDCPTGAITIRKVGEKQFEADVDMGRCIFCAQCVDVCPGKALQVTPEFELAQQTRKKLRRTYHGRPHSNPPQPA